MSGTTSEGAAPGTPSGADGARARRVVRAAQAPPDDFGVVLALLCVVYLVFALTAAPWAHVVVGIVYLNALFFAVRTSRPGPRLRLFVRVVLVAAVVVSTVALLVLPRSAEVGVLDAVFCVLLATTLVTVLRRVLSRRDVTLSVIAGALSAYLLIGLLFANLFGVLHAVESGPFFAGGQPANQQSFQYFSFSTLTTIGYGDYTAQTFAGRGLATFEGLVAQVFLATLVARLVSAFRRPERPGDGAPHDGPSPGGPVR